MNYLGFRIGEGAPKQTTPVDQLIALSNVKFHTPDSIVVPDSVESIGSKNTPAYLTFQDRGPFDVINLDVCGGVLHGEPASLLSAIKAILLLQNPRVEPWLLFLTTMAKHEFIKPEVLAGFFKTIKDNCESVSEFKDHLTTACGRCGVDLGPSLDDPATLSAAEDLAVRAKAIVEATLGAEHPWLAPILANLAELYRLRKKFAHAQECLQRGMAIVERSRGRKHPDVALYLNRLAGLAFEDGDYRKAQRLYERAFVLLEEQYAPDDPRLAQALHNLVTLCLNPDNSAQERRPFLL